MCEIEKICSEEILCLDSPLHEITKTDTWISKNNRILKLTVTSSTLEGVCQELSSCEH